MCVACCVACCGKSVVSLRMEPNAYVIDIVNGGRLDAKQKAALIGAAILIDFTYYLPEQESEGGGYDGNHGATDADGNYY